MDGPYLVFNHDMRKAIHTNVKNHCRCLDLTMNEFSKMKVSWLNIHEINLITYAQVMGQLSEGNSHEYLYQNHNINDKSSK